MNKTVTLLVCTFLSHFLFSQNDGNNLKYSKHRIGINLGNSIPTGKFSKTNTYAIRGAGFAQDGKTMSFSYQYRFHKNIAGTLHYGSTTNNLDHEPFQESVKTDIQNHPSPIKSAVWIDWETEPYRTNFTMIGVKAFVGEKVKAYINPMIGYGKMVAPSIDAYTYSIACYNCKSTLNETIDNSIIYGVSTGVDLQIIRSISINLDLLYLTSEFEVDREIRQNNKINTYNMPYSTMNISLGIGFHFL